jgi:myo-inositol-1(or 4)-monophosphatase
LFVAEKGQGAFLNNRRLRVAARTDIHDALISCPLPHRGRGEHALSRAEIASLQGKVIGLRHLGSATLEIAYVAAGRLDGMWQRNLAAWDLAAGIILMREAGGFIADCDSDRNPLETGNIVAANADLLPQIKRELAAARKNLAA